MWEGLKKVRKTRSENAGWGGREGGREREKRGGRESGPKSRHSVLEGSKKVGKKNKKNTTRSENAGRGGSEGGREAGREGGRSEKQSKTKMAFRAGGVE